MFPGTTPRDAVHPTSPPVSPAPSPGGTSPSVSRADGRGAPVDQAPTRVRPRTQRLAGTGAEGQVPGSVTTRPDGSRVITALVPTNRVPNLEGRAESFQVAADVPMRPS